MSRPREEVHRFRHVRLTLREHAAVLTLERPPYNILTTDDFGDLPRVAELIGRSGVAGIVVTGAGHAFSACTAPAELDAEPFSEFDTVSRRSVQVARRHQRALAALRDLHLPMVAALNGACTSAGLEIALVCHVRIGTRRTRFTFPETAYGLIPAGGGIQLALRHLGSARAYELLLSGGLVLAEQALEWGLLNRLVSEANLLPEALRWVHALAGRPPGAVQTFLATIEQGHAQ